VLIPGPLCAGSQPRSPRSGILDRVRWWVLVAVLFVAMPARAETVDELLAAAHNVVRDGRCEALPAIGERVQALAPAFYASVFAVDPLIADCTKRVIMLAPVPVQPPSLEPADRSPATALTLSLASTVAGYVVAAEASTNQRLADVGVVLFLVGPTIGQAYAGNTFNRGLAVRAGGLALVFIGAPLSLASQDHCCAISSGSGAALLLTGFLMYIGGATYEIATAPEAARRYNREHRTSVAIVPTGGGIALAGRF